MILKKMKIGMIKKDNIRIYCHPTDKQNIQVGGWNICESDAALSVCVNQTNINITFKDENIEICVFEELENGDLGELKKEFVIEYIDPCSRMSHPDRSRHMFIKDFFNFAKSKKVMPNPKQMRFFNSNKKNEKNPKHNRRTSS